MTSDRPKVCVFAPTHYLTVTVESSSSDSDVPEIHFHPGGQGFWVARMLDHLQAHPILVAPIGGEAGDVLLGLTGEWNVELAAIRIGHDSPSYVHDRRGGERNEIARTPTPALGRHEVDEFYGRVLQEAASSGICVVSHRQDPESLSAEFYERLGADLRSVGAKAVGDLHGEELEAFLSGGPLHTLKVSDEDIMGDGVLTEDASLDDRIAAVEKFHEMGADRVVVSCAKGPAIALIDGKIFEAAAPRLQTVDHRGSGDSMTAALTISAIRGYDAERTLRMACAAGAANVTRHGLANAHRRLIEELMGVVEVDEVREVNA